MCVGWNSWQLRWQRICLQCRRPRFDTWTGTIPWRREWLYRFCANTAFLHKGLENSRFLTYMGSRKQIPMDTEGWRYSTKNLVAAQFLLLLHMSTWKAGIPVPPNNKNHCYHLARLPKCRHYSKSYTSSSWQFNAWTTNQQLKQPWGLLSCKHDLRP